METIVGTWLELSSIIINDKMDRFRAMDEQNFGRIRLHDEKIFFEDREE